MILLRTLAFNLNNGTRRRWESQGMMPKLDLRVRRPESPFRNTRLTPGFYWT